MRCPHCNHKLLQKSQEGATKVRIRGPVTFSKAGLQSQCFWCSADVVLPAKLDPGAAPTEIEPRFVLRRE